MPGQYILMIVEMILVGRVNIIQFKCMLLKYTCMDIFIIITELYGKYMLN